jgi:hypothetical protein
MTCSRAEKATGPNPAQPLSSRRECRATLGDDIAPAHILLARVDGSPLRRGKRRETMAKGQKKSNKEARKPKKEVKKTIAANPSTKGTVVKD